MKIEIGKGLELEVNTESLREQAAAWNHVVYMGLRNILMDSHASVTEKEFPDPQARRDASLAAAQKKLDALMRNEVRTVRAARISTIDPVEAEAQREARVFILGRARGWEKGKKEAVAYVDALRKALNMEDAKFEVKDVLNAAIVVRSIKPAMVEAARKIVEAKKSIQVDMEDLGL